MYTDAVAGVVASAMDRANADAELRRRAYYDHLTGLPNRALTIERLERALQRAGATGGQIAVLQLDIDNFRVVNDSLGYQAGDALLAELPARVRPELGLTDTIARFGGDELVILCSDVESPTHACEVAQRVLDSLRAPFLIDGSDYRISASVGLAVSNGSDGADAKTLLRDADTAMYRAKAAGRGSYELFTDAMHDRAVLRLRLEHALRGALDAPRADARAPADRVDGDGRHRRLRGAAALDRPRAGDDLARRLHPAGRGDGSDRRARPLGAAPGVRRRGDVGAPRPPAARRGQRLAAPARQSPTSHPMSPRRWRRRGWTRAT